MQVWYGSGNVLEVRYTYMDFLCRCPSCVDGWDTCLHHSSELKQTIGYIQAFEMAFYTTPQSMMHPAMAQSVPTRFVIACNNRKEMLR